MKRLMVAICLVLALTPAPAAASRQVSVARYFTEPEVWVAPAMGSCPYVRVVDLHNERPAEFTNCATGASHTRYEINTGTARVTVLAGYRRPRVIVRSGRVIVSVSSGDLAAVVYRR